MLDRTMPFYNIILTCQYYQTRDVILPEGYRIVPYQEGFEKGWARLEYAVGDFDSPKEAEAYFAASYMQDVEALKKKVRFLLNHENIIVGTCIAWQDPRGDEMVPSLHWLVVEDSCQGQGLGKALCVDAMNLFAEDGQFPVYIHTQPWSWKAIILYLSLGFRLQQSDSFSHYVNQYPQAMAALKNTVSEAQFNWLVQCSEA